MSKINIVEMPSARDIAVKKIRNMMRVGKIRSGERIDQRELASKLNLTTSPLREALSCLEQEGLVYRMPGFGVFCKAYTVDEIENLIEIRGALEGLAAARASVRLIPKAKEKLYTLASRISDSDGRNSDGNFIKNHIIFHKYVAEIGGNEQLDDLLQRNHIIEEVLSTIAAHCWAVGPHDHIKLTDAIASGDPLIAEKAMRDHIAPTYKERLNKLRREYKDRPVM